MAKNPTSFQVGQGWKVSSQSKLKDLLSSTLSAYPRIVAPHGAEYGRPSLEMNRLA